MKLSKREFIETIATLFYLLSEGKKEQEIADYMGLDFSDIEKLKEELFRHKTEELRTKPIEHTYIEYLIKQTKNVNDLTKLVDDYDGDSRNLSAVVGAIRARSEIYKNLFEMGQTSGVIKKVADRKETFFGIAIQELSKEELQKRIVGELGNLGNLVNKFGDGQNILALPAPTDLEIYDGPAVTIDLKKKKVKKKKVVEEDKPKKKKKKKKRKKVVFEEE